MKKFLSQPVQTHIAQFRIPITFLTGYTGRFKVTNKSSIFYFPRSNSFDDVNVTTILPGAYELEYSTDEIKRIVIEYGYFEEGIYP